ncbi:hypothetical protein OIU78_024557 [Salix suchowensis]|nr:hypothetical protein OIU78_024557 [Salix suchowensis]
MTTTFINRNMVLALKEGGQNWAQVVCLRALLEIRIPEREPVEIIMAGANMFELSGLMFSQNQPIKELNPVKKHLAVVSQHSNAIVNENSQKVQRKDRRALEKQLLAGCAINARKTAIKTDHTQPHQPPIFHSYDQFNNKGYPQVCFGILLVVFRFNFSGGMNEGVSLKAEAESEYGFCGSVSVDFEFSAQLEQAVNNHLVLHLLSRCCLAALYLLLKYPLLPVFLHTKQSSLNECHCSPFIDLGGLLSTDRRVDDFLPEISPNSAPQPLLPLLAPSPLAPYHKQYHPKVIRTMHIKFHCFPNKDTNTLALNGTVSKYCLSDIEQILVGQGAAANVNKICSIHPSNLTEGACPVKDVNEFEGTVDSSKLLASCENIDPVKECCNQVCQNAILEAATKIALKASEVLSIDGSHGLTEQSTKVVDCKQIVLRWLAGKLNPSRAKEVLRGLSNCKVNNVCPLVFPDMRHVAKGCGNGISNKTECCSAMGSYVSHLQKQSLITNLQALNCATTLGKKLQRSNITKDVYSLCHITLKDFSLQESGCLLPSLPSDATFDQYSGISFICDLNDNIPAPWPSTSQLSASCNKTIKIPALPAAANAQSGLYNEDVIFYVLFAASSVTMMLMQSFV